MSAGHESFELGMHDRPVPPPSPASHGSRLGRLIGIAQLLGALVAVPAGIGSAYTMYKVNFSPEATCQSLRSNIIALLDRSVDASTRRILVRRDVESFERSCGAVDPETTAAFKTVLSADKAPAPTWTTPQQQQQTAARTIEPPPAKAEAPKAEPPKSEPAQTVKAEPAPAKPKPPVEHASTVAAAPAQAEAPVSDAAWVAAVRGALVKHERETETASIPSAAPPVSLAPPPHPLGELPAAQPAPQALTPVQPAPTIAAPTLPPPSEVGAMPASQADPDRPVPPGAIPEQQAQDGKKRSRIGAIVEDIPFFGKSLADKVWR